MTGERNKFRNLDESIQGHVRFDDGSTVQIKGKGTMLFQFKNGEQRLITEVYYIPALSSNIIGRGQLTQGGSKVITNNAFLWLYDSSSTSSKLLMKIKCSPNRLYKMLIETSEPICMHASISDPAWLWHARLGHLNFQSLKLMADRGMVYGLPKINHPTQVCDCCLIAKQARLPFLTTTMYRAKE